MAEKLEGMTVGEFLEADVSGEIGVKIGNAFRYQISCTEKPGQIFKSRWWRLPPGWALIAFWRVKASRNAHLQLTTSLR